MKKAYISCTERLALGFDSFAWRLTILLLIYSSALLKGWQDYHIVGPY